MSVTGNAGENLGFLFSANWPVCAEGQVDDAIILVKTEWIPADRIVLGEKAWVFALVAPFKTVQDGVSEVDLQTAWLGNPQVITGQLKSLAVHESDYQSLVVLMGGASGSYG